MSTLQSTVTTPAEVPPLRDYINHMNMYQYMQNCLGTQSGDNDHKGSLGRFCTGYVSTIFANNNKIGIQNVLYIYVTYKTA